MRPILFHLGELPVPAFWTMALLGFVAAFFLIRADVLRRGYDATLAYDMVLYCYIGGWVGARLFIIPTAWEYFARDPIGILFSGSGWVWYGGVVGGGIAVLLLSRRSGVPMRVLGDIAAPALALGLAFGRIGCQLSGDGDYGVPTSLPWGMAYPDGVVPTTDRVHPAPVYEMLGCFAILAFLWRRFRTAPGPGDLLGHYLVWSGVLRFAIEFIRRNPAWLIGLTTAQWFSLASVALGVWLIVRAARTPAAVLAATANRQNPDLSPR
jgi:phosphatidylglycerol:prolipoprotein diacylglycerol transferase